MLCAADISFLLQCVMCNVARLKSDSPVSNRTPEPDDQRNNSAGVPSICTGGSNRLTATTEIEVRKHGKFKCFLLLTRSSLVYTLATF